jgi:Holliday junction resolvasome RuvABC endonuclease subunit
LSSKIVIGIDPSSHGFHAAVLCCFEDGDQSLALHSSDHPRDKLAGPATLVIYEVARDIWRMLRAYDSLDVVIFIEEPVVAGARNIRSSLLIAQVVGGMIAMSGDTTQGIYLVPVATWKKVVIGSGNASKEEVTLWLNRVHPAYAADCAGEQDFADACCLALYGVRIIDDAALLSAGAD